MLPDFHTASSRNDCHPVAAAPKHGEPAISHRGTSDAQPPARRPPQTGRKKNANVSKGDTHRRCRASRFASPDFERDLQDHRLSTEQPGQSENFQRHVCAVQSRSAHGSTAAVTLSVVRRLGCGYGDAGSPLESGLQRNPKCAWQYDGEYAMRHRETASGGSTRLAPGTPVRGSPFILSQGYAPHSTRVRKRRMLSAGHPALTVPIDWPCRRRHRADNCLLPD